VTAALVAATREDAVCVIELQRPEKLNALSTAVERRLHDLLAQDEVRTSACIVIAGAGRAFSAGADIGEFTERTPEAILAYYRETGAIYEEIAALPQPTICAIHGYCLGGGLELALATDFRIADETAVFGFPEVGLGILPSSGGTHRAVRLVGPARAKELILLRERVSAVDALTVGLVTEVVASGQARTRSVELARQLAALPPTAVAVIKQAIDASADSSRDAALLIERLAYAALAQTHDAEAAAEEFGSR
jgi:enoyl-CoA hydratase/carnithine racemase